MTARPMRPQKQKLGHDPGKDIWGDCYRTAIAIVLGIGAEDVPHFNDNPERTGDSHGVKGARDWLREYGLGIATLPYPPETDWADIMRTLGHCNPGVPVLVSGMGARGNNHVVVTLDGEVYCDPATGNPDQAPFIGPCVNEGEEFWWVEFITLQPGEAA